MDRGEGGVADAGLRLSAGPGEQARLTPEGPTAAVVESRGPLPLRARSLSRGRAHPGTAVALGGRLFEVVAEEPGAGYRYRLEPWPADQAVRDRVAYGERFVAEARRQRRERAAARLARPLVPLLEALAATLPRPERQPLADRLDLDVVRGALVSSLACLGLGGVALIAGFIQHSRERLDAVAGQLSAAATGPEAASVLDSFQAAGPWAYFLRPGSLLLGYLAVTGFVRLLHTWANRDPLPDPALALALGSARAAFGRGRRARALARLGPERPDRVLREGRELVVLSAREKPDWNERATIQVGEEFYRLRSREEREQGGRRWLAYRLAPVEAGAVFRGLLRYDPPAPRRSAAPAPEPPPEAVGQGPAAVVGEGPPEEPPAAGEPPEEAPREPSGEPRRVPAAGPRTRWRVEPGEEARLTPEGPSAAVVESRGGLPLRPRAEAAGVHHRPAFPGTCLLLGGRRYEVVAEEPRDDGHLYRLEPWRRENVLRDALEYGPRLVRAAQRERLLAERRARAARHSNWLLPLLGLLPEAEQRARCDRLGLDPVAATLGGALLEVVVGLLGLQFVPGVGFLFLLLFLPAIPRAAGALALGEVAGGALGGLYSALRGLGARSAERADPLVLPLTREAFWQRLERPDRQQPQPDGSLLVESSLPHVGWGASAAGGTPPVLSTGRDYWRVGALEPRVERGRLVHGWRLSPLETDLAPGYQPQPPGPRHYQDEVLEGVGRQWEDLFQAAPFLPCLLPRAAQARACRWRGGPAGVRGWAIATAVAEIALAAWFATGAGAFNVATGVLLAIDGAQRLVRAAAGEFAPSVFGALVSDYLRPERAAYQAHLRAERDAMARLRGE